MQGSVEVSKRLIAASRLNCLPGVLPAGLFPYLSNHPRSDSRLLVAAMFSMMAAVHLGLQRF
eukprot:6173838-Pleurochrysis_carterae.AAC.2